MRISSLLIKLDNFCDYIPVISSLSNIVDIFLKIVIIPNLPKPKGNHCFSYLNNKSFSRCCILMIPVLGNIYVGIQVYREYAEMRSKAQA